MMHVEAGGELGIDEFLERCDPALPAAKHAELLLELQTLMTGQELPGTPSSAAPEFSARSWNRQPAPARAARGGGAARAAPVDLPVSALERRCVLW